MSEQNPSQLVCGSCRKPKAPLRCELCGGATCKSCAQKLAEDSFSFLAQRAPELSHRLYCGPCFFEKVSPALDAYEQLMRRARKVIVYVKNQGEETRLMKRQARPIKVTDCRDRDETLLRLAFFAADAGFNALLDVSIAARKVRNEGYQTMRWDGVAIPTTLDPDRLPDREASRR